MKYKKKCNVRAEISHSRELLTEDWILVRHVEFTVIIYGHLNPELMKSATLINVWEDFKYVLAYIGIPHLRLSDLNIG